MTNLPNTEEARIGAALMLKLQGLGIRADIVNIEQGPIVTGFYFKLHNSVPIAKVMNKSEDFALAAGVESVQIVRIGGNIVIYTANKERQHVDFKKALDYIMRDEKASAAIIPICLGTDTKGNLSFLDLVTAPHVLIAGSTGSGKSVFESAILSTLGIVRNPKSLEIYTVDTKKLDLPLFASLPIVKQSVDNLKDYLSMMENLLKEHERRAIKMQNMSVRNLAEYNNMVGSDNGMPYIMLLIDEFGDLITQDREARKDKDNFINELPKADFLLQRLAQVGRATGMHIIACTQRTSVKIVSGDIKANFPCRISLKLPTQADSMTILGMAGAENLLGKGDMLVQRSDSEILHRYHGPYVKYKDILEVVSNYKEIQEMYRMMRAN